MLHWRDENHPIQYDLPYDRPRKTDEEEALETWLTLDIDDDLQLVDWERLLDLV